MTLSDRLKQARESLGLTQREMASAIKTSQQTWQVYESGKSVPGGKVLEGLARLGINVNWLLTGEGEVKISDGGDDFIAGRFREMRGKLSIKEFVQKAPFYDKEKYEKIIQNIEEEKEYPSYSLMNVIFNELGINPLWLFGYFDSPMLTSNLNNYGLNLEILRNIIKEAEIYEAVNPGSLSADKKTELIVELYKRRMKQEE